MAPLSELIRYTPVQIDLRIHDFTLQAHTMQSYNYSLAVISSVAHCSEGIVIVW